jgi:hypothetical protein
MFGIRKNKAEDTVLPEQPAPQRRGTMIVYYATDGWRWRLVAPNGHITADSGEAYGRRFDAKMAALRLPGVAESAVLEVRDRG